jgi:hypothetical protein
MDALSHRDLSEKVLDQQCPFLRDMVNNEGGIIRFRGDKLKQIDILNRINKTMGSSHEKEWLTKLLKYILFTHNSVIRQSFGLAQKSLLDKNVSEQTYSRRTLSNSPPSGGGFSSLGWDRDWGGGCDCSHLLLDR